jgi:hypothetical protein
MTARSANLLPPRLGGGNLSPGDDIEGDVVMRIKRVISSLCSVVALTVVIGCSNPDESGSTRDWAADYCPQPSGQDQTVAIDWVPFVVVDGVTYSTDYSPGSVLNEEQVGDAVTSVRCRIKDIVFDPEFIPREGDAAYLPIGTEVHAVAGSSVSTRVAALEDGTWRVYEADRGAAEVGG